MQSRAGPERKKYGLICSLSSFIVRELLNPLSNGVSIRLEILVVSSLTESPLLRGFSSSWSITLIVVVTLLIYFINIHIFTCHVVYREQQRI